MQIANKYKQYFTLINAGCRDTISDSGTKLYIKACEDLYKVKVDRGVADLISTNQKKCDYILIRDDLEFSHMVEMKHAVLDAAYEQILSTIELLDNDSDLGNLVNPLKMLDVYIVSPGRQMIPREISSKQRKLRKKLIDKSLRAKVSQDELIKYVQVLEKSNQKNTDDVTRLKCSANKPLIL